MSYDARKDVVTEVLVGRHFSFPRADANVRLVDPQTFLLLRLWMLEFVDLIRRWIVEDTVVRVRLVRLLNVA